MAPATKTQDNIFPISEIKILKFLGNHKVGAQVLGFITNEVTYLLPPSSECSSVLLWGRQVPAGFLGKHYSCHHLALKEIFHIGYGCSEDIGCAFISLLGTLQI